MRKPFLHCMRTHYLSSSIISVHLLQLFRLDHRASVLFLLLMTKLGILWILVY
jgi:hypothetical protein